VEERREVREERARGAGRGGGGTATEKGAKKPGNLIKTQKCKQGTGACRTTCQDTWEGGPNPNVSRFQVAARGREPQKPMCNRNSAGGKRGRGWRVLGGGRVTDGCGRVWKYRFEWF